MLFRSSVFGAFCLLFWSVSFSQDDVSFSTQITDVGLSVIMPAEVIDLYDGDRKEILVFGADLNERLWMVILAANNQGSYSIRQRMELPDNIIAFDVGVKQANQLQSIYFLTKSHVMRYPSAGSSESLELVVEQNVSSVYSTDKPTFFRKKSFVQDFNNDGKDDFILPHFEYTTVWMSCDCERRIEQVLSTSGQMDIFDDGIEFRPARLQFIDMNNDRRIDIVDAKKGGLKIYLQSDIGAYDETAVEVPINENIDSVFWWDAREADGSLKDQSSIVHRAIELVKDVNGDNIADIVVMHTLSSSVLKQVNDYEFYFGEISNGDLTFPSTPNTRIAIDQRLNDVRLVDLNNDNSMEVLLSALDISLSDIVGALFSGKVKQDVLVFGMGDNQQYQSLAKDNVKISFSLSSGQAGEPLFRLEDVNGDGLKDLLLSDGNDKIKVRLGSNRDKKSFARRSFTHDLNLPKDAQSVTSKDLDGNGKTDFIMFYGRLDDDDLKKKIVIVTSN